MVNLYGINNCDTIRKARHWLTDAKIEYQFHDFKKVPLSAEKLDQWLEQQDWQILLNKRGMMWRKLSQQQKETINEANAREIMLATNSIIKRPILEVKEQVYIGFNVETYQQIFEQ